MTSAGPVGRVDDQQRPQDGLQGCCRVAHNETREKKERRKGTKTKRWLLLRAMHLMAKQTRRKMLAVSFGAGPEGNDVGRRLIL